MQYDKITHQAKAVDCVYALKDYNEICITGGEPLLAPIDTLFVIKQLRKISKAKLYLYTAHYNETALDMIAPHIDGIHYTIHKESDIDLFHYMQDYIRFNGCADKSNQLCIGPTIKHHISVLPYVWNKMKIKKANSKSSPKVLLKEIIRAQIIYQV